MHNRRRFLQQSAFAAAAVSLATATTRFAASAQSSRSFVIGSLQEPGSLSALTNLPHHFPEHIPHTLLFDSLTQLMPDGTVAPKLATSWNVSEDERTYTFNLHTEAKFHDGTPITAHDVVFTVEASLDSVTGHSTEGLENVASVRAIDDFTVEFVLSAISPAFLAEGGGRGIVPRHVLEGKDIENDDFNRLPIGSGPYRIVSYAPGESIIMERVPDHYRVIPDIERIEFRILSNQNVILTQLMSGELDYGLAVPQDYAVLEKASDLVLIPNPTPRFFDITLNYDREIFAQREVRAALLGGINREGIVAGILRGQGAVIDANVTPASWAYTEDGITRHPYDPKASSAALDAAGWIPGEDGIRAKGNVKLEFSVLIASSDVLLQQALLVAQQNLAETGVALTVESLEAGVVESRRESGDWDAISHVWNPVYDPSQAAYLSTGTFYAHGYSNPEIDELFVQANSRSDRDVRMPVFHELQRRISEDLPRLFLFTADEIHVVSSRFTGQVKHPVNFLWNVPTWEMSE